MICTRCHGPIRRPETYYRTKRGPHHAVCSGGASVLAPKEANIAKAILEMLALRGCFLYRQNAGAVIDQEKGYLRLAPEGATDWTGWVMRGPQMGKALQVEIKVPGKKPTVKQLAWQELAKSQGVIAFWASSVEMAEAALRAYGV